MRRFPSTTVDTTVRATFLVAFKNRLHIEHSIMELKGGSLQPGAPIDSPHCKVHKEDAPKVALVPSQQQMLALMLAICSPLRCMRSCNDSCSLAILFFWYKLLGLSAPLSSCCLRSAAGSVPAFRTTSCCRAFLAVGRTETCGASVNVSYDVVKPHHPDTTLEEETTSRRIASTHQ